MDIPTYTPEEYNAFNQPRPILKNTLQVFMKPRPYFSGDVVSGFVELKCCLGLRIFKVSCDYDVIEQSGTKNHIIYKNHQVLKGMGSEPPKNDLISGVIKLFSSTKATALPVGKFEYKFVIKLPKKLPSAFKGKNGSIIHQLLFTVHTPKELTPLKACVHLNVIGTLFDLNHIGNNSVPFQETSKKTFLLSKGELNTFVSLPGRIYPAGSKMVGQIAYQNTANREVNVTKISLVQVVSFGGAIKKERNILSKMRVGGVKQNKNAKYGFTLLVPYQCHESLWKMESVIDEVKQLKYIRIKYIILIEGDIGMATNLKMEIPMMIIRPNLTEFLAGKNKMGVNKFNLNISKEQVEYQAPEKPKEVFVQPIVELEKNSVVPEIEETQIPKIEMEDEVEEKVEKKISKKVIPPPPPAHLLKKRRKQVKEQMEQDDLRLLEEFNKPIVIPSNFSKEVVSDEKNGSELFSKEFGKVNESEEVKKEEIGFNYVSSLPESEIIVDDVDLLLDNEKKEEVKVEEEKEEVEVENEVENEEEELYPDSDIKYPVLN